jgi:hypothetical protein
MNVRRAKLSDIMAQGNRESLSRAWDSTKPADDLGALPRGEYVARITKGEYVNSRAGTPGYRLTFRVLEGEHAGRLFWHSVWLTPAALPMAKRDLNKLDITSLEQLDRPLTQGLRCKVRLVLRRDDDGQEYNRVQFFEKVGIDVPEKDPFAPADEPEQGEQGHETVAGASAPGEGTP